MRVGVLGINYKSSALNVREILAKTAQAHVTSLSDRPHSFSYVLLSTCNRTEIYFSAEDLADAHTQLLNLLRTDVDFAFEHCLYSYFGSECFAHLAKVTAGFDSVIFGESEIQRQVKHAYESASFFQTLPACLHYMFQKALKIGKDMRSRFALPFARVSLEGVIFDLVKAFFLPPKSPSVLFIGNSEINRKVLFHLKSKGIDQIAMATRAPASARSLAEKYDMDLLPWQELSTWTEFDMIIAGSNQKDYLLKKEDAYSYAEPAALIPASLVIDLSMPRSVDPELGRHPQISLFNIEEINAFVDQKQRISRESICEMEEAMSLSTQKLFDLFVVKQKRCCPCVLSEPL